METVKIRQSVFVKHLKKFYLMYYVNYCWQNISLKQLTVFRDRQQVNSYW